MIELYVLFSGGKKGQRGGQTSAIKKQTEEHETVSHTVSEEHLATLTQKLEGLSTTFVGGKVSQFLCVCEIIASLINFLLENLTIISYMRKDSENTVLILIVFTY